MAIKKKRRKWKRQPFPLKQACRSRRISLAALARTTGIARHSLSKIANGKIAPSWGTVCRIAAGLRLNLGHFDPSRAGKEQANGTHAS